MEIGLRSGLRAAMSPMRRFDRRSQTLCWLASHQIAASAVRSIAPVTVVTRGRRCRLWLVSASTTSSLQPAAIAYIATLDSVWKSRWRSYLVSLNLGIGAQRPGIRCRARSIESLHPLGWDSRCERRAAGQRHALHRQRRDLDQSHAAVGPMFVPCNRSRSGRFEHRDRCLRWVSAAARCGRRPTAAARGRIDPPVCRTTQCKPWSMMARVCSSPAASCFGSQNVGLYESTRPRRDLDSAARWHLAEAGSL